MTRQQELANLLHDAIAFELMPVVRSVEMLADHHRVHAELTATAEIDPAFDVALSRACASWRNPSDTSNGDELADVLRVIRWMVHRIGQQAEELASSFKDVKSQ